MIRPTNEAPDDSLPWGEHDLESASFCVLWATGPDTSLDGVFRIQALRPGSETGAWLGFDRYCDPFGAETGGEESERATATARMAREYGVTGADISGAPPAAELWSELVAFLGDGPILVADVRTFQGWARHLGDGAPGTGVTGARVLGLDELCALFLPGRLAQRRDLLVHDLVGVPGSSGARQQAAFGPAELQRAFRSLTQRLLARDHDEELGASLTFACLAAAWRGLFASEPEAAGKIALALELVDRPGAWSRSADSELPLGDDLPHGRVRRALVLAPDPGVLVGTVAPRCAAEAEHLVRGEPLPPDREDPCAFPEEDRQRVDDVFQVHLPRIFGAESGVERPGQLAVARRVADALADRELLLVHAPTGTGKTLAYLVPALLWSRRHSIRVGIATYTRALQEQAMDREVPRALAALARTGITDQMRVSVLKGRENYVCWRSLKLAVPGPDEDGAAWLAWGSLASFALNDNEGDLDRMPRRAPVELADTQRYERILRTFLDHCRARTACCSHADDRKSCAAEVARRRAERSHVVVTNHAFALARQEFLRHIVFDECEHLHDVAHSAWSHRLSFRRARELLSRILEGTGGRRGRRAAKRGALARLRDQVAEGSPSSESVERGLGAAQSATESLADLEIATAAFQDWRERIRRERDDGDEHSLFREYVNDHDSAELLAARYALANDLNTVHSALAEVAERIDSLGIRGVGRVRRSLELSRADLEEITSALEAWLPRPESPPPGTEATVDLQAPRAAFRRHTFYDVERDLRGEDVACARVLLPNEFLGRHYHPQLASGVFLSATTWLNKSFSAAEAYLGLDRVANPGPEEEREPRPVATFRAPEVFDYGRVLVAIPRDAPTVRDKEPYLDYVRRFVGYLAERTRGRMLVLFTNSEDVRTVGERLRGFFRARRLSFWFQGMEGATKEELGALFRSRVDSVLFGVDTFWYGADFPGETLEYLVLVRLPYGVPDRYHHAQRAALGAQAHADKIYFPRALAKFRQGFGRLMRKEADRGCVFVLDGRVAEPRHRRFLRELPLHDAFAYESEGSTGGARIIRGDTDRCVREALGHMGMQADVRRRGLEWGFNDDSEHTHGDVVRERAPERRPAGLDAPTIIDVNAEDLPY